MKKEKNSHHGREWYDDEYELFENDERVDGPKKNEFLPCDHLLFIAKSKSASNLGLGGPKKSPGKLWSAIGHRKAGS